MASFQSNNKDIRRAICQAQPGVGSAESRQVVQRTGRKPDVTFPENRHVRSPGLSGAPSLAHQPKRSP